MTGNTPCWLPASLLVTFMATSTAARADDWPMWRYDAQRSAASGNKLPAELRPLWKREFTSRQPVWDDPLNLDLMTYDRVFEPIVMDGRLYLGFNDRDKLLALDADTGRELWSVYAEAPVRLPPAGWNGRIFFCSDDGFLYCVSAEDGRLLWKFGGAPSSQHALGNRRLTSAWPARGGPVVRDGSVYFAASIWPFMGTFLYALNAETGEVQWVNDSTGSQYIKQPHSAPSFAGVAPQGALVATESLLLVPGGRSVPAVFDRSNGRLRYFELNAGGKGTGGSFVSADSQHYYVHTREKGTRAFEIESGTKTAFMPNQPVLADGLVYAAEVEDEQAVVRAYDSDQKVIWQVAADGRGDLILAGDRLVAGGEDSVTVIQLPTDEMPAHIVHSVELGTAAERLIVADNKLFVVTLGGDVLAFGAGKPSGTEPIDSATDAAVVAGQVASGDDRQVISSLLASADAEGYAFWFGSGDDGLLDALVADSPFTQLAVVDENAEQIDGLRRKLDAAGRYGRVTAHQSGPRSFQAPKYVANMIFVAPNLAKPVHQALIAELYESVRPYGGVMHLLAKEDRRGLAEMINGMNLEQARVEVLPHSVAIRREGALPGSADWTHQYGNIANTVKSNDRRVKLPLGVLWFGGSSNMDVLPRHGHGPPEQVVGGRLFIQGMNCLSARDVYTGRVLWKREFQDLGTFDVYYDSTYENVPLNPKYNQVHIPGANGRGTNYVVTDEAVYIVEGSVCHALDPATGRTVHQFHLPPSDSGDQEQWGYVGVYQDVLIGGLGFAMYRGRNDLSFESDQRLKSSRAGFGSKSLDRAASAALVGFDRHSGKQLWQVEAKHSFWHNGIVAGREQIYCLDKNPQQIEEAMRRRGRSRPDSYRIVALDYRSGEVNWEVSDGIFGTWLGYSEEHDLLLQAGAKASDRLYAEVAQGMAVYAGTDGTLQWKNETLDYAGPCILHNDLIITNANSYSESAGAYYLKSGKPKLVKHPLTGKLQPWKITRAYGCNNIIASENLLTFRSGAAGFFDLLTNAGTGNLGGFKSGCTSNLVVANGVLNAPDYTRTCSCAYQNQTSLALVHMPEIDVWSVNTAASVASSGERILGLGVNLGAPGDRRDPEGLLWLEHPTVAGASPPVSIELNPEARFFQHHSSAMKESDRPWVLASGVEGVSDMRVSLQFQEEFNLNTGLPIEHADDDAEENEQGAVSLGSSDLEFVEDSGSQIVGLRFNDIQLSRGAVIRSAHIQFTCDEPSSDPTSLIIAAEDSGNAERFSDSSHDLSRRSRTSAEVAWKPEPWSKSGEAGAAQRTPNLAPLLQAVVDRPDWQPGNSLAILVSGAGKRVAAAYKGSSEAPRLIVDAEQPQPNKTAVTRPVNRYDVRLYFGAPRQGPAGVRVFDVYLQDECVVQDVTLNSAGDSGQTHCVHLLENIPLADELHLRFVPKQGLPILSGVEIVQRGDP